MLHLFHKYTSTPVALVAVANPWLFGVEQIDPWVSLAVKIGGGILLAVQIRYWWKKSG